MKLPKHAKEVSEMIQTALLSNLPKVCHLKDGSYIIIFPFDQKTFTIEYCDTQEEVIRKFNHLYDKKEVHNANRPVTPTA